MQLSKIKIYNAALYYRLSDEDRAVSRREKKESDSISGQKNLIKDFLKNKTDINIVDEYTDDGVSGSSFSRPAFNEMMEQIESGKIDCVIVKDLSRFGREYIDAGNLLERVFPSLGVRFISVNDNVDTLYGMDSLTIALKNIMNDEYCRDISIKIRSHLTTKRNHGEFVGSYAIYGYQKDPKNRHQLIIDEYAAQIVQQIFSWKINGLSCKVIAERLNDLGVLSPYDYKEKMGLNYATEFKVNEQCQWVAMSVRRILDNENYTGTLVQGKTTTPNHKVKKLIVKDSSQWARVENTHEAIVTRREYELAQKSIAVDSRTPPGQTTCYPLSGMMKCGDCGSNMIRKSQKCGQRVYIYYECMEHKKSNRCSSHRIREEILENTILQTIQTQIDLAVNLQECMKELDVDLLMEHDRKKLQDAIKLHDADVMKYRELISGLYEDLRSGFLTKDDYSSYKQDFSEKKKKAEKALGIAQGELQDIEKKKTTNYQWIENFLKYQDVGTLTRAMVLELVDEVLVFDKNHIEIRLAYRDEYAEACKDMETVLFQMGKLDAKEEMANGKNIA